LYWSGKLLRAKDTAQSATTFQNQAEEKNPVKETEKEQPIS
jgi:hypothetical protein